MTHHFRSYQFDPSDVEYLLAKLWKLLFDEYNFKGDVYYTHKWGEGHYITFIKYDKWTAKEQVHVEYILGKGVGEFSLRDVYTGWELKDPR